tara:strand:- start:454 stop:777 length:324 start_codon:yes stop_codon:yes gene_type:complete
MTKILIFIIKLYQYFISPILGNKCRFLPTCSDYFIEALKTQGLAYGFKLGIKRILKCHPFERLGGSHGLDLVPISKNPNKHEGIKKILDSLQRTGWKLEDKKEGKNG